MPDREEHVATDRENATYRAVSPRRKWLRKTLYVLGVLTLLGILARVGTGYLYRGPRTMAQVTAVMPGVPIFPLSEMSSSNTRAQRAMAVPLWLMRKQGAKRAELAQIYAPADAYFIAEWYRRIAPSQGWSYVGEEKVGSGTRIVFTREREALQVVVGETQDILTPVQLIYLQGVSEKQKRQLSASARDKVAPVLPERVPVAAQPPPTPAAGPPTATPPAVTPSPTPTTATPAPTSPPPQQTVQPRQRTTTTTRRTHENNRTTVRRTERRTTARPQQRTTPRRTTTTPHRTTTPRTETRPGARQPHIKYPKETTPAPTYKYPKPDAGTGTP